MQSFSYHKLALMPTSFHLIASRCSNHAMRALDDVDTVTLAVPYAKLDSFLTPYGKAVLRNQGDADLPTSVYGQLLRGTVGKATPITMLLTKNIDGRVIGNYFYDQFGVAIGLGGEAKGDSFELTETASTDDAPREIATLRLQQQGAQLKGTWTNKADGKVLDMQIAP